MEESYKIESVIIDTGIIYALADKKDSWHKKAFDFITIFKGKLVIPSPAIPEVCYLLNIYLGQSAEMSFIHSLINKELSIEHFNANDLIRCAELLKHYDNLNLGFVDASIVAISERLKIHRILTTDRRHFSVVKPKHCEAFTLLP
ncbi:MAG: PIN domain-containing protein [Nitrospirota bacterium]